MILRFFREWWRLRLMALDLAQGKGQEKEVIGSWTETSGGSSFMYTVWYK